MFNSVRETICTRCEHRDVCKHKETYLEFLKAQENLYAEYGSYIEFIRRNDPDCKFHDEKTVTALR